MTVTRTLAERLFARLVIDPETGCLNWTGSTAKGGYGQIQTGKPGMKMTHRVMYEMFAGPVPDTLDLDHLCRNRRCANVAHLEPVTHRENVLRGEGLAARQASQTHCKRGHEFTRENTKLENGRRRHCRACQKEYR